MGHETLGDICPVFAGSAQLEEINRKNQQFWEVQSSLIADAADNRSGLWEELTASHAASSGAVVLKGRHREVQDLDGSIEPEVNVPRAGSATPEQFISTHDVTKELKRLGVTEQHLQSMRFRNSNRGFSFDFWTWQWEGTIPTKAISLAKAYCALKWLFLENPPRSRDRQDAEDLISQVMVADVLRIGETAKRSQSARARKSRVKIGDNGETVRQVIEKLVAQHPIELAKDLWTHLWGELDKAGCRPFELQGQALDYTYYFGSKCRKISLRRFQNIVSEIRRKKKSR